MRQSQVPGLQGRPFPRAILVRSVPGLCRQGAQPLPRARYLRGRRRDKREVTLVPTKGKLPPRSLCDQGCCYAYGHLCFSVPVSERRWVKEFLEYRPCSTGGRYSIYIVLDCLAYRRQEGRVRLAGTGERAWGWQE